MSLLKLDFGLLIVIYRFKCAVSSLHSSQDCMSRRYKGKAVMLAPFPSTVQIEVLTTILL